MTQQRRLTSLAKRWASLTLSANIITSSSCVGKAGSFFPIRLSILWKSSTSYLKGKKKKKKRQFTGAHSRWETRWQFAAERSRKRKNDSGWRGRQEVLTGWQTWLTFPIVLLWLSSRPCGCSPAWVDARKNQQTSAETHDNVELNRPTAPRLPWSVWGCRSWWHNRHAGCRALGTPHRLPAALSATWLWTYLATPDVYSEKERGLKNTAHEEMAPWNREENTNIFRMHDCVLHWFVDNKIEVVDEMLHGLFRSDSWFFFVISSQEGR